MFFKKRKDGSLKKDGDPMIRLMPYLLKGRNESAVYYRKTIPLTEINKYLANKRSLGKKISLFSFLLTSFYFLIQERPELNNFVSGRRLYQRDRIDIQYVVKQKMLDSAKEALACLTFSPSDTIYTVQEKIEKLQTSLRVQSEDDSLFSSIVKLPKPILNFFSRLLYTLDRHNCLPSKIADILPFYSTIFVSNLASIGAEAAYHHLYEIGTTSIFLTLGKEYKAPYEDATGEVKMREVMDVCITVDERICDGFYLVRSFKYWEKILRNPEFMEKPFSSQARIFEFTRNKPKNKNPE